MSHKQEIRDVLLDHVGKENAINASEIAEIVGIDEGDTYSRTRRFITEILEEGVPVASNPGHGYWIIETQDELDNYVGALGRRARQIDNRRIRVIDAAEQWPDLDLPADPDEEYYQR